MKSEVDISSLSISKSNPNIDNFEKYDIQANIDEIENTENNSSFKYTFTILSDPKNIRIGVDGIIKIFGKVNEREAILEKNENNIPKILPMIYQELFPGFFMLSKSASVPCPPYQILTLGAEQPLPNNIENEKNADVESQNTQQPEEHVEESIQQESTIKNNKSDETLQEQYSKISKEYNNNPTEELRKKLETISAEINKQNNPDNTIESTV